MTSWWVDTALLLSTARSLGKGRASMCNGLHLLQVLDRQSTFDFSETVSRYQMTWLDFLIGDASVVLQADHQVQLNGTCSDVLPDSLMMHCSLGSDLACGFSPST